MEISGAMRERSAQSAPRQGALKDSAEKLALPDDALDHVIGGVAFNPDLSQGGAYDIEDSGIL